MIGGWNPLKGRRNALSVAPEVYGYAREQWKHTSPLTPSAQRAHIFAEYTTLGVDGQQPYTTLLANAAAATTPSSPQPNEPSATAHAPRRQTGAEGRVGFLIPWLRTAYHPSADETSRR
ncbi:uncharacterized protein BO72DRAFT_529176 [Aspergillus fijiensis CBS 313.89]|uniref:Uncharacterized protein n=1 Tax=Aspergillus fijiensis CBS 313.89 TaxID=1448319 RepID=A0A8G1VWI6_9EURO|nr:uncharacterized protein BO72DRAFT_529176 [Aspergillus fijiensis CBS 313.89]RAK75615.1 hypothetical protein BO72DRAFT_529176 [Aspergillus fijiensis CBS 313.89]